jgi:hypothetical protein
MPKLTFFFSSARKTLHEFGGFLEELVVMAVKLRGLWHVVRVLFS